MVFQNPATQEMIYNGSIGSTMPNLNQGILGALKVPNPSLEEQQEIVNQVQRLFQLADSLEAKYTKAMHRIEKIEQSLLAKAFNCELVS
jgi:type I restriction enzyme S subunit